MTLFCILDTVTALDVQLSVGKIRFILPQGRFTLVRLTSSFNTPTHPHRLGGLYRLLLLFDKVVCVRFSLGRKL